MARNGGAQGMWWLARNIANATCTVAATVQESLWKFPHPPPPTVSVEVMVELLVVAAVPQRLKPLYPLLLRCWPVGSISIILGLPLISTNSITDPRNQEVITKPYLKPKMRFKNPVPVFSVLSLTIGHRDHSKSQARPFPFRLQVLIHPRTSHLNYQPGMEMGWANEMGIMLTEIGFN